MSGRKIGLEETIGGVLGIVIIAGRSVACQPASILDTKREPIMVEMPEPGSHSEPMVPAPTRTPTILYWKHDQQPGDARIIEIEMRDIRSDPEVMRIISGLVPEICTNGGENYSSQMRIIPDSETIHVVQEKITWREQTDYGMTGPPRPWYLTTEIDSMNGRNYWKCKLGEVNNSPKIRKIPTTEWKGDNQ